MRKITRSRLGLGVFFLLLVLLPSQLGKHFWVADSYLQGVRVDYLSPTLYVTDLLVLLLLGLSWPEMRKWFRRIEWRRSGWVILILGLVFLNVGLSQRVIMSGVKLLKMVEWVVLVGLSVFWVRRDRRVLVAGLSFGLIWVAVLAGWQMVMRASVGGWWYFLGERSMSVLTPGVVTRVIDGSLWLVPYSSFSHPNVMAGFAILVLMVLAVEMRKKSSLWWLAGAGCVVAVGLVVISWSQTGWLAMLLVVSLFWLIPKNFGGRGFLVVMVAGFLMTGWLLTRPRLALVPHLSVSSRVELNRAGMEVFSESPLFGQGLGNMAVLVGKNTRMEYAPAAQPAHHIFIIWLYELGAVVLGGVLMAVGVVGQRWKFSRVVGVVAVVFWVTGSLDHYWWTGQQTWLLSAVVVGWLVARRSVRRI